MGMLEFLDQADCDEKWLATMAIQDGKLHHSRGNDDQKLETHGQYLRLAKILIYQQKLAAINLEYH